MRERLVVGEKDVITNYREEVMPDNTGFQTFIDKRFTNKSKMDREFAIHKALLTQKVPVFPLVGQEEDTLTYKVMDGESALKIIKGLEDIEIDSPEWYDEKEYVVTGISEWLTCYYLALFLVFNQRWLIGNFDLKNIIFTENNDIYFRDFEEATTGFWEDDIAKICGIIITDDRISPVIRNEIARSFRNKMIINLNLDKSKIDHAFLRQNNNRVR